MRYLGTITVNTASEKKNTSTAVPFVIPDAKNVLRIRSDHDVTIATGSNGAKTADAATGFPVSANTDTAIPKGANVRELSVRNDSGSTAAVKVWVEQ